MRNTSSRYFTKNSVCTILSLLIIKLNVLGVVGEVNLKDPTGWTGENVDRRNWKDPSGWDVDQKKDFTRVPNLVQNNTEELHQKLVSCEKSLINCKEATVGNTKNDIQIIEEQFNRQMVFLKRYINLLLESAGIPYAISEDMSGIVEVRVSAKQLELLRAFCDSNSYLSDRELDSILSDLLHKKELPKQEEFSLRDYIQDVLGHRQVLLLFGFGSVVMLLVGLLIRGQSFASAMFIVIFSASYCIEYYKMYQEMDIEQMVILKQNPDIPHSCYTTELSWQRTFSALFSFKDDECQKYYKAIYLDPLVEVSPVRVLSSVITDFCLQPADKLGQAVSKFSAAVLGNLPSMYGWLIYPFWSILVVVVVCFGISLFCGGSLRLSSFLVGMEISGQKMLNEGHAERKPALKNEESQPSSSTCNNVIEAVGKSGIENYVVMDSQSLQVMLSTLMHHRNPVQDLGKNPTEPIVESPKPCCSTPGSNVEMATESPNEGKKTDTACVKLECEGVLTEALLSKEPDQSEFVFVENNVDTLQTSETTCDSSCEKVLIKEVFIQNGSGDATVNS